MSQIPLLLIAVLVTLFSPFSANGWDAGYPVIPDISERNLKVRYSATKTDFVVAEPIFVTHWLENYGDSLEYYATPEIWHFRVIDEDGHSARLGMGWPQVSYVRTPFIPGKGDGYYQPLQPHESTHKSTGNILSVYGQGHGMLTFYLPPGQYRVFSESVKSDTLTFTVHKPQTTQDSGAAQMLVEYMDDDSAWASPFRTNQVFERLLSEFPQSVHVPLALDRLLGQEILGSPYDDPAKIHSCAYRLVTEFPDCWFAFTAMRCVETRVLASSEIDLFRRKVTEFKVNFAGHGIDAEIDSLTESLRLLDITGERPLNKRSLVLRITTEKTEYLELEPIFLTYWVENWGDFTEQLRLSEILQLSVRDHLGNTITYRGPADDHATEAVVTDSGIVLRYSDWVAVPPKGSTGRFVLCLLDFYGWGRRFSNLELPAGTYSIAGRQIKSDTIAVQIIEPTGSEIKAAEFLDSALSIMGERQVERQYSAFQQFLFTYPNSAYTCVALRGAYFAGGGTACVPLETTRALGLRLLTEYPRSGFVWEVLVDLDPSTASVQEQAAIRKSLTAIISAFPSTQYERRARELLDGMDE